MVKKILIGVAVLFGLFVLFVIWAGTSSDTPTSPDTTTTTTEDTKTPAVVDTSASNFVSDKGNFSINFEGTPTYKLNMISLPNGEQFPGHLYQYTAADGSVWQALFAEYPKNADVSNAENLLLNTVKGIEGAVSGKIVSTKVTTYQGFPAIDYLINIPEQKFYYRGRNVLNGKKIYSVSYIYDDGHELPSESFFNSLKIGK